MTVVSFGAIQEINMVRLHCSLNSSFTLKLKKERKKVRKKYNGVHEALDWFLGVLHCF